MFLLISCSIFPVSIFSIFSCSITFNNILFIYISILSGEIAIFKIDKSKRKKEYTIKLAAIATVLGVLGILIIGTGILNPQEKPEKLTPSVSIGCDRVLWLDSEEMLEATTKNISKPSYEWKSDGNLIGTSQTLLQKFGLGEHIIQLNVTFDNQTISANKSIIIIDSVEGINMYGNAASKNQWRFQTMFKGKSTGVKGVVVYVDSLPPSEVNTCGVVSTKALFSGNHTWKAQFHGVNIASGTFNIKETSELKIDRIEIAPSYTAGSIVKAKIVVRNTGSVTMTEFGTKTLLVNQNFAWMGDKAKREFSNQYNTNLKPGETYEIPIEVEIPEKVNGIRPSGKYTVTISLLLKGETVDTKIVTTEVK